MYLIVTSIAFKFNLYLNFVKPLGSRGKGEGQFELWLLLVKGLGVDCSMVHENSKCLVCTYEVYVVWIGTGKF